MRSERGGARRDARGANDAARGAHEVVGVMHGAPTRHRAVPLVIASVCLVTLAGCSGAPSESDMKFAIDRELAAQRQAVEGFVGKQAATAASDMSPQVRGLRKIGCNADGEKAYRCDVEVEVTAMGNTTRSVSVMRFVKSCDGWRVAN